MKTKTKYKSLATARPTLPPNLIKLFKHICNSRHSSFSTCSAITAALLQRNSTKNSKQEEGNNNGLCIEKVYKDGTGTQILPSIIFAELLQVCVDKNSLADGKRVHSLMSRVGYYQTNSVFLLNHLLNMYVKCGGISDARQVFDKMPKRNIYSFNMMIAGLAKSGDIAFARQLFDEIPQRDVVSWTAIIGGYAQNRQEEEALQLFRQMLRVGTKPKYMTFATVMSACSRLRVPEPGVQLHAHVIHTGFESYESVGNAMITMYASFGSIESARLLFNKTSKRDVVSWNAMIAGYVKCRDIELARQLFDIMPERNIVSWTVMITGYGQLGYAAEAVNFFKKMLVDGFGPDQFTFSSVVSACAGLLALEWGKQVHAHSIVTGFESDVFVGSVLVDMYIKCGNIENAVHVFDRMPEPNVVSWTSLIIGHVQKGHGNKALNLFCQMQYAGIKPNGLTFASVLSACASLTALERGTQVHAHIVRSGFETYTNVCNALLTMYSKSGSIDNAELVFKKMLEPNEVSCTAMIVGYSEHGLGKEALEVFDEMISSGLHPDHITFIGVLSACNRAGLVDKGREYFDSMIKCHRVTPKAEHYACMIDLLGKAGYLDEAECLIHNMPFEPDAFVWGALLTACRTHGNVELGKRAADKLFELKPEDGATYILLSNIYAAAGRWEDAATVRKMMKDRGVKKDAGWSWIEVKNKLHVFVAGTRSHPQLNEITEMFKNLAGKKKESGYLPDTTSLMQAKE